MAAHTNNKIISAINVLEGDKQVTYDVHDKAAFHDSSDVKFADTDFTYFKDPMMEHVAENLGEYACFVLEDGKYVTTEKYERIELTGIGTFLISEGTLEFEHTDDTKWKIPSLNYVANNLTFDSIDDVNWKTPMLSYIRNNISLSNMPESFRTEIVNLVKDIVGTNTLISVG